MNKHEQLSVPGRPVSLVVVVLLWVVGIPLLVGSGLALYSLATQPQENPGVAVLVAAAALAYVVLWPFTLYQALATRRRGQPLY
jgi:divalent metal cation (Fe/Co/Zn/Cd) transporter